MKRLLIFPAICALASSAGMLGADVYFYHGSGDNPVGRMLDARKLVFNETSVDAMSASGLTASVANNDFDYILFRAKSATSGILTADSQARLSVSQAYGQIIVDCNETIEHITITDVTGRQIGSYTPASPRFTIGSSALPKGLVIVSATSGSLTTTAKLFIN
ncbi:MAG: T9SS type A sorting domain-containing protein [Muribaculaceae bacterium]|nr:T9SS type A sorting domain-containing protein [Muribaculaceae bacterium]